MNSIRSAWKNFSDKHPALVQFLFFFVISNAVTLLQLILMPLFKWMFDMTGLVGVNFQIGNVGTNFDGTPYFIFNYAAGKLGVNGGGGGLAYFLAVQITITIAQIINFFLQRNITFKSNSSIAKAAFWYIVAYLIITIGAAALQGLYKAPIYNLFIHTFAMGHLGETLADMIVMLINCTISFWVFFPIFKFIFKKEPESNS